jgi:hypothetical protein
MRAAQSNNRSARVIARCARRHRIIEEDLMYSITHLTGRTRSAVRATTLSIVGPLTLTACTHDDALPFALQVAGADAAIIDVSVTVLPRSA